MGGQTGDTGTLNAKGILFQVSNTESPYKGIIVHVGKLIEGELKINDEISASIDSSRRQKIANNHTATHLLHWALLEVLGEHVKQGGSVVEPERLRFDFNHHKALSPDEIRKIEDLVNHKIRENEPVETYELSYDEAQKRPDIKQFFGEKYGSKVRVVDIAYSKELCGGTHTKAVGTIGLFRIAKEGSISAGTRRIEAVTGEEAELLMRESEDLLHSLAASVKTQPHLLMERIAKLVEENANLTKELQDAKKGQMADRIKELLNRVETVSDIPLLIAELPVNAAELKVCADEAILKLHSGVVVFAARETDKCHVLVRVSEDLVGKGVKAGEIVQAISPIIDGKGGGKANAAQAGGKAPERIGEALDKVREFLAMTLKK
jgi:alanyl-tRNA synthetase